jgi:hypothetical protein
MKHTSSFRLEVIKAPGTGIGLSLRQGLLENREPGSKQVVRIWGAALESVLDRVLEILRRSGIRPSELKPDQRAPFELPEEQGVRLGLLFLAVKPLRRPDRIAAVSEAVHRMEAEEAYFWFAKCSRADLTRRACRSLRILLAEE